MILSADLRTVLVHFDAGADLAGRPGLRNGHGESISEGTLDRIRWYLEWSSEGGQTIHALVPDDLAPPDEELLRPVSLGTVIRYRDERDLAITLLPRRGFTFIVNGNQFPIVHWRKAVSSAQRQNADVVVFGPVGALTGTDCPESVLVDSDGQVIHFKRHYVDSPGFADRWSGDAAFLVVKSELAQSVAAHIVVRGWGLDSIGALVRRYAVRWLSDNGAIAESRLGLRYWGETYGNDARGTRNFIDGSFGAMSVEPRTITDRNEWKIGSRTRFENHDTRLDGVELEDCTSGALRSNGSRIIIDGSSGEHTLALDDHLEINDGLGYLFAKRALDIVGATVALIVLSPLLIVLSVLVKLTSRGPIFYAHTRQGLGGREFPCLKFRSMLTGAHSIQSQLRELNEVDGPQFKITRDPRVTGLGSWLRKTNMDELPQLLNVLLGHMSLVGPRPSPDQENQYCPAWRRARLSTKPGITGLWQVLRKREECASDFQEWIYYDVEYARHRSFWLDVQILVHTPIAMYAPRHVAPFAARLERADICVHLDKLGYKLR